MLKALGLVAGLVVSEASLAGVTQRLEDTAASLQTLHGAHAQAASDLRGRPRGCGPDFLAGYGRVEHRNYMTNLEGEEAEHMAKVSNKALREIKAALEHRQGLRY